MDETQTGSGSLLRRRLSLLAISVCLACVIAEGLLRVMVCISAGNLKPLLRKTVRNTLMIRPDPTRATRAQQPPSFTVMSIPTVHA